MAQDLAEPAPHAAHAAAMGELRPSEIPIPDSFCCSITREIMEDPVCTVDGHSYEREAIVEWLRRHQTSPNTNLDLPSRLLTQNFGLKKAIQAFLEQRPELERRHLQQADLELAIRVREEDFAVKVSEQGAQLEQLWLQNAALESQVSMQGAELKRLWRQNEQP